jgi:hypothetical protein
VYKLRIHRAIWIPYFVGRTRLGIVFLLLLIVAGSVTGPLVSALQFQAKLPATLPLGVLYVLVVVSICINLSYLMIKSRADFLVVRLALVPTLSTYAALSLVTFLVVTLGFVAFSVHIAWSNVREVLSDHYTAVLLITSSQVSLIALLFGLSRFLSADAVDLDAIGTLIKKLVDDIRFLSRVAPPGTQDFARLRLSMRETLGELLKKLDPTPVLAVMPDIPTIVGGVKAFQRFDKSADDTALKNELSATTPAFVQALAATIGERP